MKTSKALVDLSLTAKQVSRFWAKVNKTDTCWLWTASTSRHGYGNYQLDGRPIRAHRLSYYLGKGPIASNLSVCHHCDTPACVNPAHLFLGSHTENMRDCIAKGRHSGLPERAKKTHCLKGHAFTSENTMRATKGGQACRTCHNERKRLAKAAKRLLKTARVAPPAGQ